MAIPGKGLNPGVHHFSVRNTTKLEICVMEETKSEQLQAPPATVKQVAANAAAQAALQAAVELVTTNRHMRRQRAALRGKAAVAKARKAVRKVKAK